jgi:CHAT domain-containing protein
LWWSPTGQIAFLPLHAAGHHTGAGADAGPARTVPDRVVSSYAPTIRTLLHVRAQAASPATTDRMLVVAMPHTPGATDLQGAENEARALAVYRPTVLSGPAATHEAVRDAMAEASCVHFACHAVSEPTDPSLSRLLVHDHSDHPLTVADISRLRLPGARLAYLSACDTARTAVHLADEAVHIATAFQLAGFPHVVGTLWRANDTFAARLAAAFHATLPGHSTAHCADALHRCLLAARDAYPVTPSLWAPYLHTGA